MWVARYTGVIAVGHERPYSIELDGAGNVYVTGESHSSTIPIRADYAIVKYNSSGVQQWVSRYNGSGNSHDYAYSIAVGPSGNVCVTGSSEGIGTNADYATVQYSPSGVQQWVRRYNFLPTSVPDEAYSVAVDGSDNVYVTGYSSKTFGNYDYATIKYNSSGDSLWVKRYNGSLNNHDKARALVLDGSANVYVTGYSRESMGGDNYTTIKYNTSGAQQWLASYTASIINNSEDARSIALDGIGNVYVTGFSGTDTTLWDYATVKYSQTGSSLTLNLTAFIEGFYNSVSNIMISDTARVFLKNISSPYNTIDSTKGIFSSSGTGTFLFSNAINGVNYYLIVKHRNSIETWSSSGNVFSSGTLTYNFSTISSQSYGSNEIQVDASPVRFAIYSGDVNQDGSIDLTDGSSVDNDAGNFIVGYVKTDVTGDNFVDVSDLTIVDNNAYNFVSKITP
ncbi:MAG: SBBP repeat-containing protein [Bacteroidota bacterium]|nr:SBBP repeat-containing protein [Bacteroidota bacterium]